MTPTWAELLRNPEALTRFYTVIPSLEAVTLRSVHLDRYGPTVTLRLDLPRFPDQPLPEWTDAGCDRFQCQVQFLAVNDFSMSGWEPPVTAAVYLTAQPLRRVSVDIRGEGTAVTFSSSDVLAVGRISAFQTPEGGVDQGRHYYAGKLDSMLYSELPPVDEKNHYERV